MNSFVELFHGIPIVILISVLFGLVALIRIYIISNPGIRRLSTQDRRQSNLIPIFPFKDKNNNQILGERRKLSNRRLASHVIVNYCVIH